MSKFFRNLTFLFLLAAFAACQGTQHSGPVNSDTEMLAVPPMFDAPLPGPTPIIVPLATDSTKQDSNQKNPATGPDSTHLHAVGSPATKPHP
ncbi:MAG: hypothetical protein JST06_05790 [Bacteroidetes bacterium]|nr:hypothetical protein [Bacteroidota bacterium]MBS1629044.1 hypothetical protein [Bacteroidota bacterium]